MNISQRTKSLSLALILFLFALFVRVQYLHHADFDNPFRGDAISYVAYAENLNEFGIFSKEEDSDNPEPDSYWAPGYPVFIVIMGKFAKAFSLEPFSTLLYAQALLGALICLYCFYIGKQYLTLGFAFSAAFLTAISPHLISMGGYILTETLFSFLLLVSIYYYVLWLNKRNMLYAAVAGILFALTSLVNPVIFFAPFILILFDIITNKSANRLNRQNITFLILFCLITGSWSLRNYINVAPEKASSSQRILTNLIIGSHDDFYKIWRTHPLAPNNPATIDEQRFKGEMSEFIATLADRIAEHPGHYAKWYFIDKPLLLWSWNILIGQGDIFIYPVKSSIYDKSNLALLSHVLMKALHPYLFFMALLGLFFLFFVKERNMAIIPLYSIVIYVSAVYVCLQAEPRYSIPLRPEMYLCAMFFLSHLMKRVKRQK